MWRVCQRGHVFVLGGDFNTIAIPSIDEVIGDFVMNASKNHSRLSRRRLMAFLDDCHLVVPQTYGQEGRVLSTWERGDSKTQIDYIGISRGAVSSAEVCTIRGVNMSASDHFPVHARVEFEMTAKEKKWDGAMARSLKGWQLESVQDLEQFKRRALVTCRSARGLENKELLLKQLAEDTPHSTFNSRRRHGNLNINRTLRSIRKSFENVKGTSRTRE